MDNNYNCGKVTTIVLNYIKDPDLFGKTAQHWSTKIVDVRKTKKTQIRNFYEKILELEEKADVNNWEDVIPFVKMLNSKVAYSKTRGNVCEVFQDMMQQCINQVEKKEDLKIFKLFFESVLGFYKEPELKEKK